MVTDGLKPREVFRYFEEICSIPHGSSDTKRISDYCVDFAKKYNLKYIQDESNNVIIFKPATKGYEGRSTVMIQGHLDMVCEKEEGCTIDFSKDGLTLMVSDDIISAKGTTLGGDDGIAVAYGLALLASDDIKHPPLEVVFTVDEEIGMLGASELDCTPLKSRYILNLDSEEEGVLLVSCAGGVTVTCSLPVEKEKKNGIRVRLSVEGLTGGHSGVEIDKGRANACQILGRILYSISQSIDFNIINASGGLKDNAIPRSATVDLMICEEQKKRLSDLVTELEYMLKNEYRNSDGDLCLRLEWQDNATCDVMSYLTGRRLITALYGLPGGVQKMSRDIEGLVQTSLNMGILKASDEEINISFSVRSSVDSEKKELVDRLECLMKMIGGSISVCGDYPAWEYKKDSVLRELMKEIYTEQTGKEPVIQAVHAGVECGIFAGKMNEPDAVSFGPDIYDIHTPKERMSISSVERTWNYLIEILKRIDE